MKKRTRKLQFSRKEKEKVFNRDNGRCIFCKKGGFTMCEDDFQHEIKDIMHYVPKSAGGLGIEQNGAVGCRYHHTLLDNGSRGMRKQMLVYFEKYLKSQYSDWKKEELVFKKYNF